MEQAHARAWGARLIFQPPYHSPVFSPINQAFAKFKTQPRKADDASSVEHTWNSISTLLDAFSEQVCGTYLVNVGYGPTYNNLVMARRMVCDRKTKRGTERATASRCCRRRRLATLAKR